jgi:opacity protein-like surface antigen
MKGVHRMKWLLVLFAAFALTASAADVTGTWKASTETPNGTFETTFVFKVDGTKLTGSTTNQMMGEKPISEGKIDGDDLTFTVNADFNGNQIKLDYKGKVTGNEMKLTLTLPGGDRTFDMTAKKVS